MSVIISLHSSNGIVVGADRRTTVRENGVVRYSDETCKIFPFSEGIVITHCGDKRISKDLTVHDFLKRAKRKLQKVSIFDLPTKLLSYYMDCGYRAKVTFHICGYGIGGLPIIYLIRTENKTIEVMSSGFGNYNWVCSGTTDVATSILRDCDINNLSIQESISLVICAVESSITAYKYRKEQIIGGFADIYVITDDFEGWILNNDICPVQTTRDEEITELLREKLFKKSHKGE
jgi:hypothetical protein